MGILPSNCRAARYVAGLLPPSASGLMKCLMILLALVCLAALPLMATEAYVATSTGDFVEYDTLTGSYTLIGNTLPTASLFGMGYNSGVLYANDSQFAPNTGFYSVNTGNAGLTKIGNISGTGSQDGSGTLTAPIGGGTLYYLDESGDPSGLLYSINPNNAVATAIGHTGIFVGGQFSMNFAPNGQLYASNNSNFYQINTSTGAATLLGSDGLQVQALLAGDGNLYAFSGSNMYTVDLTDGALTFVRSTPAELGIFYDGTDVLTPEPGTLVMLGSGLLAAAGAFRRKCNV